MASGVYVNIPLHPGNSAGNPIANTVRFHRDVYNSQRTLSNSFWESHVRDSPKGSVFTLYHFQGLRYIAAKVEGNNEKGIQLFQGKHLVDIKIGVVCISHFWSPVHSSFSISQQNSISNETLQSNSMKRNPTDKLVCKLSRRHYTLPHDIDFNTTVDGPCI